MDWQGIFDTVVREARKQKAKSHRISDNAISSCVYSGCVYSGCAYRGANGAKCFVGMVIPDELYHENMEGKNLFDGYEEFREVRQHLSADDNKKNRDFISELVSIHDRDELEEWEEKFKEFAKRFNLTVPEKEQD